MPHHVFSSEELKESYDTLKKEKTEAEEKHLFVQQRKKVREIILLSLN